MSSLSEEQKKYAVYAGVGAVVVLGGLWLSGAFSKKEEGKYLSNLTICISQTCQERRTQEGGTQERGTQERGAQEGGSPKERVF